MATSSVMHPGPALLIVLLFIGFVASAMLTRDRVATNPYALVAMVAAGAAAAVWFAAFGLG